MTGPTRPLPDQTLTLTIESSESPAVKIKSPAGERYWGCRGPWIGGKLECTLPPGVSLDSVVTTGHCADFSCGNDASACPPPAKRFARVTAG